MEGRDPLQKVAATRSEVGTDVNYGEITRQLIAGLQKHDNFSLQLGTVVRRFKRNADKSWTVTWRMPTIVVRSGSLKPNLSLSAPAAQR